MRSCWHIRGNWKHKAYLFKAPNFLKQSSFFSFLYFKFYFKLYILGRVKSLLKQLSLVLTVTLLQRLFTIPFPLNSVFSLAVTKKPNNIWHFILPLEMTNNLGEELYGRITMEELLLYYRKPSHIFKNNISVCTSAFKKGIQQWGIGYLFQRRKRTMGLLAHHITTFQISKYFLSTVFQVQEIKLHLAQKKAHIVAYQGDIYSNSYSILQSDKYSGCRRA